MPSSSGSILGLLRLLDPEDEGTRSFETSATPCPVVQGHIHFRHQRIGNEREDLGNSCRISGTGDVKKGTHCLSRKLVRVNIFKAHY